MNTYNFDAFGNPIRITATSKLPATVLHSDGVYDSALAAFSSRSAATIRHRAGSPTRTSTSDAVHLR